MYAVRNWTKDAVEPPNSTSAFTTINSGQVLKHKLLPFGVTRRIDRVFKRILSATIWRARTDACCPVHENSDGHWIKWVTGVFFLRACNCCLDGIRQVKAVAKVRAR